MNPAAAQLLVFDSGVGGLSIVEHLRERLPGVGIDYLADNQCFPYGMMNDQQLINRVVELIDTAQRQLQPDLIVIACNSASTLALPALRKIIDTPIVGVVPAIKPAAQLSETKVIGLLATPGTIKRDYTDDLIAEFAPGCDVIRVGSSQLVEIVEQLLAGQPQQSDLFMQIVQPFHDSPAFANMDTVVLACTHFPLVKEHLAAALPQVKHWVDSGEAIARRVASLLAQHGAVSGSGNNNTAWLTNYLTASSELQYSLSHYGFHSTRPFPGKAE